MNIYDLLPPSKVGEQGELNCPSRKRVFDDFKQLPKDQLESLLEEVIDKWESQRKTRRTGEEQSFQGSSTVQPTYQNSSSQENKPMIADVVPTLVSIPGMELTDLRALDRINVFLPWGHYTTIGEKAIPQKLLPHFELYKFEKIKNATSDKQKATLIDSGITSNRSAIDILNGSWFLVYRPKKRSNTFDADKRGGLYKPYGNIRKIPNISMCWSRSNSGLLVAQETTRSINNVEIWHRQFKLTEQFPLLSKTKPRKGSSTMGSFAVCWIYSRVYCNNVTRRIVPWARTINCSAQTIHDTTEANPSSLPLVIKCRTGIFGSYHLATKLTIPVEEFMSLPPSTEIEVKIYFQQQENRPETLLTVYLDLLRFKQRKLMQHSLTTTVPSPNFGWPNCYTFASLGSAASNTSSTSGQNSNNNSGNSNTSGSNNSNNNNTNTSDNNNNNCNKKNNDNNNRDNNNDDNNKGNFVSSMEISDEEVKLLSERLRKACFLGDFSAVESILDHLKLYPSDSIASIINSVDDCGFSPLHYSAFAGHYEIIRLLLESEICCNLIDFMVITPAGDTILHSCVRSSNQTAAVDITKLLYFHTRKKRVWYRLVDAKDFVNQRCALTEATINGNAPIVELLLGGGASLSADKSEMTALHYAALQNEYEIVEILCRAFPSSRFVNSLDAQSNTPLHYCLLYEGVVSALVLLAYGADPVSVRNSSGSTVLDLFQGRKRKRTVEQQQKQNLKQKITQEAQLMTVQLENTPACVKHSKDLEGTRHFDFDQAMAGISIDASKSQYRSISLSKLPAECQPLKSNSPQRSSHGCEDPGILLGFAKAPAPPDPAKPIFKTPSNVTLQHQPKPRSSDKGFTVREEEELLASGIFFNPR